MSKKWIIILSVVLVAGVVSFFLFRDAEGGAQNYQTAVVSQGTLQATVTSTGTITAVGTVEVGTQVSGTVEQVLVDYNDEVRRGQLLARLDTRVLQASVDDAQANLERTQAQYRAALDEFNRNKPLFDKKYISATEFTQYRSSLEAAKATVTSAQVALQRARTNFGYAEIRSPSDGTVIQRTVEEGQTVAASLSTPTLFTIANDLAHMQIEAGVDESDIGQIEEGQRVTFTVQSQPDKTFQGVVKQIRLQPETVQNVVNYTVVVDAPNNDGLLLPGMTATVSFEVARVTNVLVVPNSALRFQPSAEVLAKYQASTQSTRDTGRAASRTRPAANSAGGSDSTAARSGGTSRSARSRVWTVDSTGNLRMIPVQIGLSDGQKTEVSGPGIREGMVVVTGTTAPQAKTGTTPTGTGLPFGTPSPAGGGRRSGF